MDPALLIVIVIGIGIGAGATIFADKLIALAFQVSRMSDVPSMLIGMAGGLSFYLWRVTEGQPFRCAMALLHTGLGAFFGVMGAKAAGGMAANEELKTVAAGLGGGLGPRGIDRIERIIKR